MKIKKWIDFVKIRDTLKVCAPPPPLRASAEIWMTPKCFLFFRSKTMILFFSPPLSSQLVSLLTCFTTFEISALSISVSLLLADLPLSLQLAVVIFGEI